MSAWCATWMTWVLATNSGLTTSSDDIGRKVCHLTTRKAAGDSGFLCIKIPVVFTHGFIRGYLQIPDVSTGFT
ncbi:hypothetical protein GCM10008940_28710 [Microbulbifer agarilyticus]